MYIAQVKMVVEVLIQTYIHSC